MFGTTANIDLGLMVPTHDNPVVKLSWFSRARILFVMLLAQSCPKLAGELSLVRSLVLLDYSCRVFLGLMFYRCVRLS